MLTNIPKVGDHVLLIARNENYRMKSELRLLPVEKIGSKYLTVSHYGRLKQFPFTGIKDNYELWDSVEAYDLHLQRDRHITKIKKAVSAYSFGDGLSDEDLEQICKLIEVKS